MPEGDTIFRTARTLHRALAAQTVTAFESVLPKLTRAAGAAAGRRERRLKIEAVTEDHFSD